MEALAAEVPAAVSNVSNVYNKKCINMKKSTIITIVVIAVIAVWAVSGYNGLVKADEEVSTAWSNVENQYQRRADLIPRSLLHVHVPHR